MKKLILALIITSAVCGIAYAGSDYSGKDVKQVQPPPCPEWYGDNELNINLWGTYAFTGTEYAPNVDPADLVESTTEGHTVFGTFDRYLGGDHAWGGGGDVKYFFHRYFGVGIEGFLLDAKRTGFDINGVGEVGTVLPGSTLTSNRRVIGTVMGTFTLRYPVPCSRVAPYTWAGIGAIFGGGERDSLTTEEVGVSEDGEEIVSAETHHTGSRTELIGQFGGGLEVRITRHIGWTNDFSWNIINGSNNDFGMVRSGINFAF